MCMSLKEIRRSEGLIHIGSHAFYNCKALEKVYIPKTVGEIGEDCFEGCSEEMMIVGEAGSFAENYAKEAGIRFVAG